MAGFIMVVPRSNRSATAGQYEHTLQKINKNKRLLVVLVTNLHCRVHPFGLLGDPLVISRVR